MNLNQYTAWQRILLDCDGNTGVGTAKVTGISWSHVANILNLLERAGLIKRVRNGNNRSFYNQLTERGEKARDALKVLLEVV
jgi:DNA-binding MarR family transcriptional regulator